VALGPRQMPDARRDNGLSWDHTRICSRVLQENGMFFYSCTVSTMPLGDDTPPIVPTIGQLPFPSELGTSIAT
jgi:hypothetical protein